MNLSLIREARTSGHPGWRATYPMYGRSWEGDVEASRAIVFDARGKFSDAASSYAKARRWTLAFIPDSKNLKNGPPESQLCWVADTNLLDVARMKARQGRLGEAEVAALAALLSRLKDQGKYNPLTTRFVLGLSDILVEQGRYTMMLGEAANYVWTLDGAVHGTDKPLAVRSGDRVEVTFMNHTSMSHPMHLHGHHFQVVAVNGRRFAVPCATQFSFRPTWGRSRSPSMPTMSVNGRCTATISTTWSEA